MALLSLPILHTDILSDDNNIRLCKFKLSMSRYELWLHVQVITEGVFNLWQTFKAPIKTLATHLPMTFHEWSGESTFGREWGNRTQVVVDLLLVCSSCIYGSITPPHVFVDQFLYSTWAYTWINDQSLTILNCFFALINTWRGGGGLGGSGWSRFRICGNSFLKWNARSSHQRWNENTADALLKCNVDCIAKVLKLSDKMSHSSLPQTAKSRHPLIKSTSMDDGILSVPNIYNIQANMNLRRLVGLK